MRPESEDGVRIDRLIAGDEAEWGVFVNDFSLFLRGVVARTLGSLPHGYNPEDMEEIVQELFVGLWRNERRLLKTFVPEKSSLRTWLTMKARSAALNFVKRSKPQVVSIEDVDKIAIPARRLREGLDFPEGVLSPAERRVLLQLVEENLAPDEVARESNVSTQTVYALKSKAINKLRRFLLDGETP